MFLLLYRLAVSLDSPSLQVSWLESCSSAIALLLLNLAGLLSASIRVMDLMDLMDLIDMTLTVTQAPKGTMRHLELV